MNSARSRILVVLVLVIVVVVIAIVVVPKLLHPVPTTLDPSQPPKFGSVDLKASFQPDPYISDSITGSGIVDASKMSSGCVGYTNGAPDFHVNYNGSGPGYLSIYFITSDGSDATLVVVTSDHHYHCNDNPVGETSTDPVIDFAAPKTDTYDIWVGTKVSGGSTTGKLYITEDDIWHP